MTGGTDVGRSLWEDTDPETERVLLEMLARAPAWRKLHMVGEMNRTVRELALIGLRRRYPHDTEERLRRRLATMLLGEDLALRAYGPEPPE